MSLLCRVRQRNRLPLIRQLLKLSANGYIFPNSPLSIEATASSSMTTDRTTRSRQHFPPQRRPAWLDQNSPPISDTLPEKKSTMLHRFAISPAAADPEMFIDLLSVIKQNRPLPEWAKSSGETVGESGGDRQEFKSVLYTAPFLALVHNCVNEFIDVVEYWFARSRPLFMHDTRRGEMTVTLQFSPNVDQQSKWKRAVTPVFTLANQIEYLGRLNMVTNGRLVEKLGWRNVSFLIRRMAECGLFTYPFNDVCSSALGGILDFYEVPPPTSATTTLSNRHLYDGGLHNWLLALAHYLASAEMRPHEWRFLIGEMGLSRSSITSLLSRLRSIHASILIHDKKMKPELQSIFKYLIKLLCNYARLHFDDDIVEDCRSAMERGRVSAHLNVPRAIRLLIEFAVIWNRYRPDLGDPIYDRYMNPDYIVKGTWESWYRAVNVVASQLLWTDDLFKETLTTEEKNENILEERSLEKNMQCMRTTTTARLVHIAVETALKFDQTQAFYDHFFETWAKLFHRISPRLHADKAAAVKEEILKLEPGKPLDGLFEQLKKMHLV